MPVAIDFDILTRLLRQRLQKPLPGADAHEPLRATPIGADLPFFQHKLPPKLGSVLILFYPENGSITIPLTKRADYVGAHSGQISLPGGKREPGEDEITNALRESNEEIGLNSNEVEVLGKLTQFFVIPSNFLVTPVVAACHQKPELAPDHFETVKILELDLWALIGDDAVHTKEILAAKQFRMLAPHFLAEGEIIWGATAMMLNEFRWIVREICNESK